MGVVDLITAVKGSLLRRKETRGSSGEWLPNRIQIYVTAMTYLYLFRYIAHSRLSPRHCRAQMSEVSQGFNDVLRQMYIGLQETRLLTSMCLRVFRRFDRCLTSEWRVFLSCCVAQNAQ